MVSVEVIAAAGDGNHFGLAGVAKAEEDLAASEPRTFDVNFDSRGDTVEVESCEIDAFAIMNW